MIICSIRVICVPFLPGFFQGSFGPQSVSVERVKFEISKDEPLGVLKSPDSQSEEEDHDNSPDKVSLEFEKIVVYMKGDDEPTIIRGQIEKIDVIAGKEVSSIYRSAHGRFTIESGRSVWMAFVK